MISVDGVAVEFGGTTLFSDISFVINEKDRIALMGKTEQVKAHCLKYWQESANRPEGIFQLPKSVLLLIFHSI